MKPLIPVIIKGTGRIPRLGTLAPRGTVDMPVKINLVTLEAIIRAPFAPTVFFIKPDTKEMILLTFGNYQKIFKEFSDSLVATASLTAIADPPVSNAPSPPPPEEPVVKVEESNPVIITTENVILNDEITEVVLHAGEGIYETENTTVVESETSEVIAEEKVAKPFYNGKQNRYNQNYNNRFGGNRK